MKTFLAVFTGTDASMARWLALPEAERESRRARGMAEWGEWTVRHRDAIVQAESHEAAAALFVGHPHFMLFPGDAVELMECLPVPGA